MIHTYLMTDATYENTVPYNTIIQLNLLPGFGQFTITIFVIQYCHMVLWLQMESKFIGLLVGFVRK